MLVLSRKKNQRIQIGDNITITILQVKGATVKVGIEAPTSIRVLRSELQVFDCDDQVEESQNESATPASATGGRNVSAKATASLRSAVLARRAAMPALACLGTSAMEMALAVAAD